MTTILFFGSFQHYSTIVLEALYQAKNIKVLGVITSPPRPAGRHLKLTKTHTHDWAEQHSLPVFNPEILDQKSLNAISHKLFATGSKKSVDFFIVAGYGQLLSPFWLAYPTVAALNLHHSLLPQYPGPAPVEWALLMDEKTTGISIIKMNEQYDQGPVIAQQKLSILPSDTRLTLYQKLYEMGAKTILRILLAWPGVSFSEKIQSKKSNIFYARRLSRSDSYIPWLQLQSAITIGRHAADIDRKIRAFTEYPGTWTQIPTRHGHKRLKLLVTHLSGKKLVLDSVQLENRQPSTFNQIKNQVLDKPVNNT